MSQNIYDCTVDSLQEFNKFNAEIKVIMEERDSYQAEAESAYRDYMLIQTEIEKLKDKGISTEIASNQGSNMDLFKLRELITAGKNAVALGNNKLNNYEIRAEEYETAALFSEIMNEIVMAGKQAYDDVTVMVRSIRRSLQPPTKASEMSKYMAQIDGDLRYISKYMFEATKLTSGLSGLLVNLRPNDGVISHETRELIKGKYKTTKSELETLEKSGESMKERMCNLSMKV